MKLMFWLVAILSSGSLGWLLGSHSQPPHPVTAPLAELSSMTGDHHSFAHIISETCQQEVIPLSLENTSHQVIVEAVRAAAETVRLSMSAKESPIRQHRRINEASRYFEDALLKILDSHPALNCSIPSTKTGKQQRAGYPDLRIEEISSGTVAYLDPKLFEESSISSSLRTFYYEPSDNVKVTEDAIHLLLGFPHDGNSGQWQFGKAHLVDLSTLRVKLKVEFSAANRDLYQQD